MPSVALTPAAVDWAAGDAVHVDRPVGDGTRSLAVWVTEPRGGARIVQVPASTLAGVQWDDAWHGKASVGIKRYELDGVAWLLDAIVEYRTELQIVWEGNVVFWGPVTSKPVVLGAPVVTISAADAGWYLSQKLFRTPGDGDLISRNEWFTGGPSQWEHSGATYDLVFSHTSTKLAPGGHIAQYVEAQDLSIGAIVAQMRTTLQSVNSEVTLTLEWPRGTVVASAVTDSTVNPIEGAYDPVTSINYGGIGNTVYAVEPVALDATAARWIVIENTGLDDVWILNGAVRTLRVGQTLVGSGGGATQTIGAEAVDIIESVGHLYGLTTVLEPGVGLGVVDPEWGRRDDIYISEALRGLADRGDGLEYQMRYLGSSVRAVGIAEAVGVEWAPEDLTLRIAAGEGAVGAAGNVGELVADGTRSVSPVSRFVARSEDGRTSIAEDLDLWGGLVYEAVEQLPLAASDDRQRYADAKLGSSRPTQTWTARCSDLGLVSRVRRGDRMRLVYADGPDAFDGLVRIEGLEVTVGAALPLVLKLSEWVDPVSVGLPQQAKAPRIASTPLEEREVSAVLVETDQRVRDVERRTSEVAAIKPVRVFPDLLDVPPFDLADWWPDQVWNAGEFELDPLEEDPPIPRAVVWGITDETEPQRWRPVSVRARHRFTELTDVEDVSPVPPAVLTPGDVWGVTPSNEWGIITPTGGGGGSGVTVKAHTNLDPEQEPHELEWVFDWNLGGGAVAGPGGAVPFIVTTAGIWHLTFTIRGDSPGSYGGGLLGPEISGVTFTATPPPLANYHQYAFTRIGINPGEEMESASASLDMAMQAGWWPEVHGTFFGLSGYVAVTAHLLTEAYVWDPDGNYEPPA